MAKSFRKSIFAKIIYWFFAVLIASFFIFPFIVMINKSLMTGIESELVPPVFFPTEISFDGFKNAIDPVFLNYLTNTFIVLGGNMFFGTMSATLCAYSFSKLKWRGREVVFAIMMASIMMPGIVLQIPLYMFYVQVLNWTDTLAPLWVPSIFGGGALNIFLVRQFMRGLPKDIDDAARIDGANTFVHFTRIILPLCMPIIVYLLITTFMGVWNDFQGPLVYISNPDLYTIPVGVYYKFTLMDYDGTLMVNTQMATGVILAIPLILIFMIFQRQLIDGITVGSIK